jgi:uncharacterized protein YbjQ (UPF0145 family)
MAKCSSCGGEAGFMASRCDECLKADRERAAEAARARLAVGATLEQSAKHARDRRQDPEFAGAAAAVVITTESSIPGREIVEIVDVITAESVMGINLLKDALAGINDVFGGRAEGIQQELRSARRLCLQELKEEAAAVGADAVVGVRLDYSEFGGQSRSMVFLVASGTAVRTAPRVSDLPHPT